MKARLGELSARVGNYMDALTGGALAMELRPAAAGDVPATRRKRRGKKDEDESEGCVHCGAVLRRRRED